MTNAFDLTVIVPAYNEAGSIKTILAAVASVAYETQVVVVDDGSTDGTAEAVESWASERGAAVELLRHPSNRGKGAAIRTGLERALGRVVIIQDADLEYDPRDYRRIVEPILAGQAQVVYGSRYLRPVVPLPWTPNRACVVLLNLMVRLLYGGHLSDEATCYKAFASGLLERLDLRCERFEFCPEVTAKLCRLGVEIREVPIGYTPRSNAEGKKIRWSDGLEAIATLLRWRFAPFRPLEDRPRIARAPLPCALGGKAGLLPARPGGE